jgi:hypothetical protein
MAKLKVTLENHQGRRYHNISHGPGRRAATTYGRFGLRYPRNGARHASGWRSTPPTPPKP